MAAELTYVQKDLRDCTSEELELRKVRALEKIGRSLEGLQIWFEDIDKEDWSARIQWYLSLLKEAYLDPKLVR